MLLQCLFLDSRRVVPDERLLCYPTRNVSQVDRYLFRSVTQLVKQMCCLLPEKMSYLPEFWGVNRPPDPLSRMPMHVVISTHEDLLSTLENRRLRWFDQGTVPRKRGRQKKIWEDNIKDWTGLDFNSSQRAAEDRQRWQKIVSSCATTTLVPVAICLNTGSWQTMYF